MIRRLQSVGAKIVLITPPPVDEVALNEYNAKKGKTIVSDRNNENTFKYVLVVKDLAKKYNLPFVDLWNLLKGDTTERGKFLSDGLHLNPSGNGILFENLSRVLVSAFPNEFDPDNMQIDHPFWTQFI